MSANNEILKILEEFKEIEPEVIAKRLNTSVCHATNICLKLVEEGKLKLKFKVICPRCREVCAEFESIMDIPDDLQCRCGYKFMPMKENIKMVFVK